MHREKIYIILDKITAGSRRRRTPIVQRFKGLGEMNPSQLRETTMAPETRNLSQLRVDDLVETIDLLDKLLSKKRTADRKHWLETYGNPAVVSV